MKNLDVKSLMLKNKFIISTVIISLKLQKFESMFTVPDCDYLFFTKFRTLMISVLLLCKFFYVENVKNVKCYSKITISSSRVFRTDLVCMTTLCDPDSKL